MSRYVNHDAAEWVAAATRQKLSRLGEQVAHIVGISCGGIYNAVPHADRVDWSDERVIDLNVRQNISTFDFNELTNLVFLCHEARIRLNIRQGGPGRLGLVFSRRCAEGGLYSRHPNLDEAVADLRSWLPPDHPLVYRAAPEPAGERDR